MYELKKKGHPSGFYFDESEPQILSPDSFYAQPEHPMDSYSISKPHGVTSVVTISASVPRSYMRDEGRSLEAGLQERASNHLKLLW
jgi:hypothetical protein